MNKLFRFTNERIRTLPANDPQASSTELEVSDTEVTGLKCLSGKTGSKRFLLRYLYEGRKRSITIGRFPDVDVITARKIARRHKSKVAEGIDPKAEKDEQKSQPTVSEFFWNTHLVVSKTQKSSWDNDIQRFRDYIEPSLGQIRYRDLTAAHIQQLQLAMNAPTKHRKAYAPATCNRALALLKTMGNHALRLGIVDVNEALKIRLLKEDNARTRFLDLDESQRLIQAARNYPVKAIGGLVAMLLITGCRISELRNATYKNLDRENRTLVIPPHQTKNRRGRTVYLSDLALEILDAIPRLSDNPHIFTGRFKGRPIKDVRTAYRRILQEARIEDRDNICFHTLRHSTASNMVSAGFSLNDVKAQLAHRSIQSSERYAKLTTDRMQRTSDKLADLLQADKAS